MKFIYAKWDDALFKALKGLSDLMSVYNFLLMRLNGNVEDVLKMMEELQAEGYIDAEHDLEEFKKQLEENKLIKKTKKGFGLTPKGERNLRIDAFEQIFQKLKSSGRGQHPLPYEGGSSEELLPERRPYTFGDSYKYIDYTASIFNSITRSGELGLNLSEQDLEVYEAELPLGLVASLRNDVNAMGIGPPEGKARSLPDEPRLVRAFLHHENRGLVAFFVGTKSDPLSIGGEEGVAGSSSLGPRLEGREGGS